MVLRSFPSMVLCQIQRTMRHRGLCARSTKIKTSMQISWRWTWRDTILSGLSCSHFSSSKFGWRGSLLEGWIPSPSLALTGLRDRSSAPMHSAPIARSSHSRATFPSLGHSTATYVFWHPWLRTNAIFPTALILDNKLASLETVTKAQTMTFGCSTNATQSHQLIWDPHEVPFEAPFKFWGPIFFLGAPWSQALLKASAWKVQETLQAQRIGSETQGYPSMHQIIHRQGGRQGQTRYHHESFCHECPRILFAVSHRFKLGGSSIRAFMRFRPKDHATWNTWCRPGQPPKLSGWGSSVPACHSQCRTTHLITLRQLERAWNIKLRLHLS